MFEMILKIFKILFEFLKPFIVFGGIVALIFIIMCVYWFVRFKCEGMKYPISSSKKVKKRSMLMQLCVDVPRRFVLDRFEREPDYFRECGIHMFCGEQGSGKTIAMVHDALRIQKEYPLCKTITNFGLTSETDSLDDWHMLIDYTNGKQGVLCCIDEIQNWFMSGKNQLPEGMLEVVTQNRKHRRKILASCQVFIRCSKAIREQCTLVYEPHTFFGCYTVVLVYKPVFDCEGNVIKRKWRNIYSFVHTEELRNAYDTYKAIHILSKEGFKDMQQQAVINNWIVK